MRIAMEEPAFLDLYPIERRILQEELDLLDHVQYQIPRPVVIDPTDPVDLNDLVPHSGQEVQRISVITNLPTLLKENNAECMQRVVPKVREVLHVAQAEMQLAASSAFLQILQKELVPLQSYTQTFLQTILNSVDSKDPEVAGVWLETLLDVIDLLPKDILKKEILPMAVGKGQLSQTVQSRMACCKILGKIATRFEPFVIKKEILPVVQSLCQDIEYEVRGCMCRQLDPVARGLGLEATKSAILPELVELTNDEESFVRLAGLETVVNILSLLDDDTCTSTIIPLVFKFCQQAMQNEDNTLPMVAKHIGKLCHSLSVNLTDDQKEYFLDQFRKLCKIGSGKKSPKTEDSDSPTKVPVIADLYDEEEHIECRRNAAFNIPAMVLFTGARQFKAELLSSFTSLCEDPHVSVRKTVASGFHEVVKLLGSHVSVIQSDLVTLLKDDNTEVLKGVISYLPETLEMLAKGGGTTITEAKLNSMSDIISALMACEAVVFASNDWRLQQDLMSKLSCLPRVCSSEQIFYKFVPLMFSKLHNSRAMPVRLAAIRTTLILLRNIRKLDQRQEMICRLIEEFCHAKSCRNRSLFIDMCRTVMELYSKGFFKEYFFEFLLELSTDTVPNIRLRLCAVLPSLKSLLKLPSDRHLLQQLDSSVRRLLINERDRDVSLAVKTAVEELDKTQVEMESLHRKTYIEDDAFDQQKEDEEKLLLELEERDKKEEDGKPPKGEKKKDPAGAAKKDTTKIPRKGTKIPAATSTTSSSVTGNPKTVLKPKEETRKDVGKRVGTITSNIPNLNNSSKGVQKNKAVSGPRNLKAPGSPLLSNRMSPVGSAGSSGSSRKSSASSQGSIPSPVNSAGRRRSANNNSPSSAGANDGAKKAPVRKNSLGTVNTQSTAKRKTSLK